METHWGDIPIRDAHVHFFSHRFFATLAALRGNSSEELPPLPGWELPDRDPARLAARWVTELDRHQVDTAVLIASVPGDEESVLAAVRSFPDRLHGYLMVDPTAADAVARLEAALAGGLRGLCLFPSMHRYSIRDERVHALLDVASWHPGTVVFVHCGVLTVGVRKKFGLPSNFDMQYANPLDLYPVANGFSHLPFVIPHFGAGFFREALIVADMCPNIYFDTSSSNSWVRYLAPEPSLREVFRRALDIAGPGRLLFGTDSSFFPRGWVQPVLEEQMKVLYELAVKDEDVAAILGGNLHRLLER